MGPLRGNLTQGLGMGRDQLALREMSGSELHGEPWEWNPSAVSVCGQCGTSLPLIKRARPSLDESPVSRE